MQQIEIDVVRPQSIKTGPTGLSGAGPRRMLRQHLVNDEYLVGAPVYRLSYEDLRSAVAVHLRSVDEGQPEVEPEPDRGDFVGAPSGAFTDMPGALAQCSDRLARGHCHGERSSGHGVTSKCLARRDASSEFVGQHIKSADLGWGGEEFIASGLEGFTDWPVKV